MSVDYVIKDGLASADLPAWLAQAAKKYGTFEDGRVNYTDAKIAPTVMCTIKCGNEILLAKRNHGLADAEGYWSTINGFIDEDKPVAHSAAQEFREELGLVVDPKDIKVGKSYTVKNVNEKRSYIIFPCLAVLDSKPKIKLDFEHSAYRWIKPKNLRSYHILSDLPEAVNRALALED